MPNISTSNIIEGIILYFDPQILAQLSLHRRQNSFDTNIRPYCCLKINGNISTWGQMTDTLDTHSSDFIIKNKWKKHGRSWLNSSDNMWLTCNHYLDGYDCTCIGDTSEILTALNHTIPRDAHRLISEIGVRTLCQKIIVRGGFI